MHITSIHTQWREKKGFVLERKCDENYYIFIHFLSDAVINDGLVAKEGGCIFYKPHSYRYIKSEDRILIHDWFHAVGNIDEKADKYSLEFNKIYYPENHESITNIVREMEIEMLTSKQFCDEICALKTEELIARIARSPCEKSSGINSDMTENFIKLRAYMQSHYYEISSVEPLAVRVNLSVSRFYTLYREIFGISPKQDLLNIRIEHAKNLLLQKHYTISEISDMLGYGSPYHFIRQFKSFTGTTPAKYSKKLHL